MRRERPRSREAILRPLRHRLRDHVVDLGRQVGALRGQSWWRLHQVSEHQGSVVLGRIRRMSREAFEEHTAERVHVGPRVRDLATELFRRRIVERPHELTGCGDARITRGTFGESEVGEVGVRAGLRPRADRDEDVRGLDVSMHEPLFVSGIERRRDLANDPGRLRRVERTLLAEQGPKVGPFHVPHRDEQPSVGFARLVDRDHVRMVDRRGKARLADEPLAESRVLRQLNGEELQCNLPPQALVFREVHDAHAAAAHDPVDPVARELLARLEIALGRTDDRGRAGRTRASQFGVLPQDLLVKALELGRRIGADLVRQNLSRAPIGIQRFRLTPSPIERDHQVGPEPLAKRIPRRERLQVGDDRGMSTHLKLGRDPMLDGTESELLEE